MARKLIGKKPKPATIWQRRWRKKVKFEQKHGDAIRHRAGVFSKLAEATAREAARLGVMMLYALLLVDPPWHEKAWGEAGMGRAAENCYRTTTLDELKKLKPPAAPVSTMFMWTTSTYLAWAMELLTAWGFEYGGIVVWDKQIIGKGRRFRLQAEFLIYGNKSGGLKPPVPRDRVPNFISIRASRKKGDHSVKPTVEIRKLLTQQYPGVSRVEMFNREVPPDDDWDVWGNEAQQSKQAQSILTPITAQEANSRSVAGAIGL